MKSLTTFVAILVFSATALAQSSSFIALKEKFYGEKDVVSVRASGFLARSILRMAGEHEFNEAIRDVRNVRVIYIPKKAFRNKGVTLAGFKKLAKKDSFKELAYVRDHHDDVTLLMQSSVNNQKDNRYLLLVDNDHELVAIEVKGYIDTHLMLKNNRNPAYDQ